VEIEVTIPPGSNAVSPVTVTAVSDAIGVAQALGSPLVFAAAGATTQNMTLSIGSAGMAHLTLGADGGLASSQISVEVTSSGVRVDPSVLYRAVGDPIESVKLTIPHGTNASAPVTLSLSSSAPTVADFLVETLVFPAGTIPEQMVDIAFGSEGFATLIPSDNAGGMPSAVANVVIKNETSITYEMNIRPYIQLGDAPLGAATDQFAIVWQTLTLARQGPDHDHFEVEYRAVGSPTWLPGPAPEIRDVGSESRRNHAATLTGLDFDSEYEYRLIHYRNGVALDGGTHQASVKTRKTDNIVFTLSANTGGGNLNAIGQLPLLAALAPDLHFFNGDVVYFYGERELFRPRLPDIYTDLMATTPTVLVTGNHEMSNTTMSPSEAYGQSYADQVFMPDNGPVGDHGRGRNYSFDVGPVHFAVVNTGLGDTLASATGPWLAADLSASSQPWKIVVSHELPVTLDPYSIDRQYTPLVREHILKPAVENGVNLFIGGAAHSYQRYRPITAVDVTQSAPEDQLSWATCNAGVGTTLVYSGNSWLRPPSGQIPSLLEAPMEAYGLVVGMGVFEISGNELTVKGVDLGGTPFDVLTLNNCQNPADCSCPVCGDGVIESPETCDDGNSAGADGCSTICQTEYHQALYGVAEGGSVTIAMDGLSLVSPAALGDQSSVVLGDLANLINSAPGLGGAHADVVGTTLIANAVIESIQVDDPGLSLQPGTETFSQALYGIALGGSVSIVLEGLTLTATTSPGQLAAAVLTDLADQINATPAIAHLAAQVTPPFLTVLAPIESFTVNDAGLVASFAVPSLQEEARGFLFLLLAGLGAFSIASVRLGRGRRAGRASRG
jgi:cysteine-rich repeat protein